MQIGTKNNQAWSGRSAGDLLSDPDFTPFPGLSLCHFHGLTLLLAGFTGFAANDFAFIFNALALKGFGGPDFSDLRGNFTHQLLVYTTYPQFGPFHLAGYPGRKSIFYRVRITNRQSDDIAFAGHSITYANHFQGFHKSFGNSFYGIEEKRAPQTMLHPSDTGFINPGENNLRVFPAVFNFRVSVNGKLSSRTFNRYLTGIKIYLDSGRDLYRRFSYSGHYRHLLPDFTKKLTAHIGGLGLFPDHDSLGGGKNRHPKSILHFRYLCGRHVNPTTRFADPLEAGN